MAKNMVHKLSLSKIFLLTIPFAVVELALASTPAGTTPKDKTNNTHQSTQPTYKVAPRPLVRGVETLSLEESKSLDNILRECMIASARETAWAPSERTNDLVTYAYYPWNRYVSKNLTTPRGQARFLNIGRALSVEVSFEPAGGKWPQRVGETVEVLTKPKRVVIEGAELLLLSEFDIGKRVIPAKAVIKRKGSNWITDSTPEGFEKALGVIYRVMCSSSIDDRIQAIQAMGEIGPSAWHHVPDLIIRLRNKKEATYALESLKNITNQDFGENSQLWLRWWEQNKNRRQVH